MKKFIYFVAIALLVVGMASPAFGAANTTAYGGGSGLSTVRTVTTVNTDYTGYDETNISSTYFNTSKCVVIGYSASVLGAQSEGLFSVVDKASTTTGDADTLIVAENEAQNAYPVSQIFPDKIRLANGLTIRQGPRTVVTVYYVQDRP